MVVTITALVLGVPLAITTWRLMEDFSRADLLDRSIPFTLTTVEPASAHQCPAEPGPGTIRAPLRDHG